MADIHFLDAPVVGAYRRKQHLGQHHRRISHSFYTLTCHTVIWFKEGQGDNFFQLYYPKAYLLIKGSGGFRRSLAKAFRFSAIWQRGRPRPPKAERGGGKHPPLPNGLENQRLEAQRDENSPTLIY